MRIFEAVMMLSLVVGCSGPSDPKSEPMVVVITNNETNNTMQCADCATDEVCIDGFCQIAGCEPVCEGTACGPNGCGGMCNPCEGRAECLDGACELPPMDCSGFAADATPWSIPALFEDEQFERIAETSSSCGGGAGEISHQMLDLDGDGRLDLVLTDRCDTGGVGTLRWDVFQNRGSGFAADPTSWSLPTLFEDEQFERIAETSSRCGGGAGEISHQVVDLTGDGRPDLVLTDRCDTGGVGTLRWEVFENTGSGFASDPTSWSLPSLFEDEQFERIAATTSKCGGGAGEVSHQLLDLTGDGLLDLVLTDRCDTGGVGTLRWDVFENTGSGFAASPTTWSLPALFEDEQFERIAETSSKCGGGAGEVSHVVIDLTGDGRPDLVLTDRCDTGGVGTLRWEVFENTGTGFAADPAPWALPSLFQDEQFERIAETSSKCGGGAGEISHQLLDVDADGLADLLLTDRCDSGGVGTMRWEYFRNEGNGFASDPTPWTVPTLFQDEQFERVAETSSKCGGGGGEVSHQVLDLDGDGMFELVLTDRCDSGGVGTARWDVHLATCN